MAGFPRGRMAGRGRSADRSTRELHSTRLHKREGDLQYLVPGPFMSRLAEFLDDHPSPTSARLKAEMRDHVRLVAPPEPAKSEPSDDAIDDGEG